MMVDVGFRLRISTRVDIVFASGCVLAGVDSFCLMSGR